MIPERFGLSTSTYFLAEPRTADAPDEAAKSFLMMRFLGVRFGGCRFRGRGFRGVYGVKLMYVSTEAAEIADGMIGASTRALAAAAAISRAAVWRDVVM
jgi:hypothetical protein